MKKLYLFIILSGIMSSASGQQEQKIWDEFISLVRNDRMTEEKIRPLDQLGDSFKPVLLGYLDSLRVQASASDWKSVPEIIRTDNRIQFLTPWSARGQRAEYCLSFVIIDSLWYFQHLESIFVRLDKLTSLPVSIFPDISESQKAWAREEIYWSFLIQNIYLPLKNEKGKEYALNLLKDGAGYFVGARTWVPFASPARAFILYLCWEQANLRGNKVTLELLSDNQANVIIESQFLLLYSVTGHLRFQIQPDEYRGIFETIWQDRAKNAGWNLVIGYQNDQKVKFTFTK